MTTSARTRGRAERGLARDLRLGEWHARRTFFAEDFVLEDVLAAKDRSLGAVVRCGGTSVDLDAIVRALGPLIAEGLLEEALVVTDGSAAPVTQAGIDRRVRTCGSGELVPGLPGPSRGAGDVLWRSLRATSAEALVLLDGGSPRTLARRALGLTGALLESPGALLVQAFGEHPGDASAELAVASTVNLLAPDLSGLVERLRPELAVDRAFLTSISVPAGEAAPLAIAIDALGARGLDALAQVRCPSVEPASSRSDSGALAYAALAAAARRLLLGPTIDGPVAGALVRAGANGLERDPVVLEERPPHGTPRD